MVPAATRLSNIDGIHRISRGTCLQSVALAVEVLSRNFEKTFKLSESSVRAAIEIRQHCALHSASPCEHRAFRGSRDILVSAILASAF
jgi:hypothetical protein